MGKRRFFTDYPDGIWRKSDPISYDGDKYVQTGPPLGLIKRAYISHSHPGGPSVTHNWAMRHLPMRQRGDWLFEIAEVLPEATP